MKKAILAWLFIFIVVAVIEGLILIFLAVKYYNLDWRFLPGGLLFIFVSSLIAATYYWLAKRGVDEDLFLVTFSLSTIYLLAIGPEVAFKGGIKLASWIFFPAIASIFSFFFRRPQDDEDLKVLAGKIFTIGWANSTSWIIVWIIESRFTGMRFWEEWEFALFVFIGSCFPVVLYMIFMLFVNCIKWMGKLYHRAFVEKKA